MATEDERGPVSEKNTGSSNVTNSQVYAAGRDIIIYQGSQVSVSYWTGRPASQGDGFVCREAALVPLKDGLSDRGKAHPRVVVISSGAGVGKSRVAAEYAHRSGRKGFWSTAGLAVEQTLAALAPALGIEVKDRTEEEVGAEAQRRLDPEGNFLFAAGVPGQRRYG